jgi:UDP-2,3-diacylglucosamine pyrophosphatase LpxH
MGRSLVKGTFLRLVIPDSHGEHIDPLARAALLADLDKLGDQVEEIVFLGDHLDCGGTFNAHQRNYTNEMTESYQGDVAATNLFLDDIQGRCAKVRWAGYLEGNHEAHIERWAARNFERRRDAEMVLDAIGPQRVLRLHKRGIKYFRRAEMYQGIGIQGTIRRGKCYFTHGIVANKHATQTHLERFADNVVHGHTHRAQSAIGRTVKSSCIGAWCPGTLAKLQPLYNHTNPTNHSHGYALQFVSRTGGTFLHFNVPIFKGKSLLHEVTALRG